MKGSAWDPFLRDQLVMGSKVDVYHSLSSSGTALVLAGGGSSKVPAVNMPQYLGGLATGNRPLYPGDPRITPAHASNPPLTNFISCTQVYIRVLPNPSAPGGWYVNSAWPE
jgi:hypothetical protein